MLYSLEQILSFLLQPAPSVAVAPVAEGPQPSLAYWAKRMRAGSGRYAAAEPVVNVPTALPRPWFIVDAAR